MAYQFNGSSQYLNCGSPAVAAYPITMAAIVYPSSAAFSAALSLGNTAAGSSDYFYLGINGSSLVQFGVSTTPDIIAYSGSAATLNTNNHFAGVLTSTTAQAYLNGTPGTSASHSVPWRSTDVCTVGGVIRNAAATGFLNGRVAEAAIWNAALTDAEILSLSRGFTPDQIRPQSLQFYAPLVRNLQDVRGGRTITNNNGATVAVHPRIIT